MGDLTEFSLPTRLFLSAYPWRRNNPVPWAPLARPLKECRVALVSSAGFRLPGQEMFDPKVRGGDPSFRLIPADQPAARLIDGHRSETFDHRPMQSDPNLAFPLDRLRELADVGRIGATTSFHLSFMGSITAPGRLVKETAPAAVELLLKDHADVALLVPV